MKLIKLETLFWGVGQEITRERIYMHKHDFYQLEIYLSGNRYCRGKLSGDILLAPGDALFIPLGRQHSFRPYKNKSCSFFSFKFKLQENVNLPKSVCKMPADTFLQWVTESLKNLLLPEDPAVNIAADQHSELVTMLLAGLLDHWAKLNVDEFSGYEVLQFMRHKIYQFGAGLSVKYVADGLNLTVPQLRYRFRKEMNSLPAEVARYHKPADFITAQIMETARTHLRTTNFSISEISSMLQFSNVYNFSRFFKRNSGISPLEYRNECKQKKQEEIQSGASE